MPLTPAHAAAALPLRSLAHRLGLRLPLSALMIGTLAPDFEYLFRLKPPRAPGVRLAAVAVLLGAASHNVWDSFTHHDGSAVAHFPILRASVAPNLLSGLSWYMLLQHGSSTVGLATLCFAAGRRVLRQPPQARRFTADHGARSVRTATVLLSAVALGSITNATRVLADGPIQALGFAAVGGMATLAVALVV
jgi:hypothetical protein